MFSGQLQVPFMYENKLKKKPKKSEWLVKLPASKPNPLMNIYRAGEMAYWLRMDTEAPCTENLTHINCSWHQPQGIDTLGLWPLSLTQTHTYTHDDK